MTTTIRRESTEIKTVADLRKIIDGLPDDMPVCRRTDGYFKINTVGDVSAFVGDLSLNGDQNEPTNVLQLCTCP